MRIENFFRYEGFILVGILMTALTLIKLLGFADFSSDWFWFIAGIGLITEGAISFVKQRRFDKKYKIVEREVDTSHSNAKKSFEREEEKVSE